MSATGYADFLARKTRTANQDGRAITVDQVHPMLHPWQREVVRWAVGVGRAALWEDTGLGKTMQSLEWARLSREDRALIIAPLAVCQQTIREAGKLGIPARYVRHSGEVSGIGVNVTNYERFSAIDPDRIDAVVLDESSVLKQSSGKLRNELVDWVAGVPRRLACSATPAPNDPEELTNQAEWLGWMLRREMLSAYFKHTQGVQGGAENGGWKLKGHALDPMIRWMSGWAIALRRPSDIGGDDTGYVLPGLDIRGHYVDNGSDFVPDGQLFAAELGGVVGRAQARKSSLASRVAKAAELVAAEPGEPWLLWCGLNDEAQALAAAIPGAVNVHGALDADEKARLLLAFADGDIRVLITKPQIAAMGMNWQHCARMAFVGLSDSYEQYYQSIRRCYRYGQTRPVQAHIVLSHIESQIVANVRAKEASASQITAALINHHRKRFAA